MHALSIAVLLSSLASGACSSGCSGRRARSAEADGPSAEAASASLPAVAVASSPSARERVDPASPGRAPPPASETPATPPVPSSQAEAPLAAPAAAGPGATVLPRHNERSPLGTNLTYLKDYTGEYAFVDCFKQSRPWFSGRAREAGGGPAQFEDKRALDLDENDWVRSLQPGQVARTLMFWMEPRLQYPSGKYVVLYEGEGRLEYENGVVSDRQPGREVIEVDAKRGGIGLFVTQTNPKNYLRNIRVLMPGGVCKDDPFKACRRDEDCAARTCVSFELNYKAQVFHPTFLDRIKTYSALRFKDWMDVDNSKQKDWTDRPKPSDARWTKKGVPIEIVVELANRLSADAWISVPHLATEDYDEKLATYLRDNLRPEQKVYVEYSNEVWNGIYEQARWMLEQGKAEKLGRDPFQGQLFYHARRSAALFKLFERVFGGRTRLVRVLGTHPGNPWASEQLLGYEDTAKVTDALGAGGYFANRLGHPDQLARFRKEGIEQLKKEISKEIDAFGSEILSKQAEIAKKYKVELVAYEGGEHLVGMGPAQNDAAINSLFDAASRSPEMKALYLKHLDNWKKLGGHLFVHHVNCIIPSKWGRFGALEYLDQRRSEAPKFDALQEFIEKNPRWW